LDALAVVQELHLLALYQLAVGSTQRACLPPLGRATSRANAPAAGTRRVAAQDARGVPVIVAAGGPEDPLPHRRPDRALDVRAATRSGRTLPAPRRPQWPPRPRPARAVPHPRSAGPHRRLPPERAPRRWRIARRRWQTVVTGGFSAVGERSSTSATPPRTTWRNPVI